MATDTQPKQRGGLIGAIASLGRMLSVGLAGLAEQRTPGWSCSPAGTLGEDLSSRVPSYEPPYAPAITPRARGSYASSTIAPAQTSQNVAS